jgi:HPt (histidine-containing phosphotransfer) domain-containing protein
MSASTYKNPGSYQLIDLSYIEQLSNGDKAFEKEIVQIFIEQIPQDLALLNTHFEAGDFNQLKQSTHYMLPSISIFGLENRLKVELEALAALESAYKVLKRHIETVTKVCNKAREEAITLLHSYA